MELGGINYTIIDPSADIDSAAKIIANFKFMNCGQTCLAANNVYVPVTLREEFIRKLTYYIEMYYGERPDEHHSYGRIVNEA